MSAIYTQDPATGERVTLSELAKRHGVHVSTLSRRYASGHRGRTLVKPFNSVTAAEKQHAKARAEAARKQSIISASGVALTRPFKHIASVSKMAGGAV